MPSLNPSGKRSVSCRKGTKELSTVATSSALDREQLILSHMPRVRLLATRLHHGCPIQVDLDDLVSAGVVGLIQAVDRFKPERGYQLKTLAEHRVRAASSSSTRSVTGLRPYSLAQLF